MSAGNTPEEAISQGISELLERYTLKQICLNELTPPTIPEDYLKKNAPKQYGLKYIENSCKCKIIVKDCSLNKGIPSIAIVMIFQDKNVFHGHLGVDSFWQIALERCLTETFQGRDIIKNDISDILKLSYEKDDVENYRGLFRNGIGVYPLSFFDDQFSYPFKGFSNLTINSQEEKLTYLLKIIKNLDCSNIYIRDVSFLGFPSYHVIIPGISETHNYRKVSHNIFNIANFSNNELEEFAKNIESILKNEKLTNLSEYYDNLPTTDNSPWNDITLDFFLSLIYYKLGEYSKAQDKLVDYVNYVKEFDVNSSVDYNYHCVAIQFLGLMSKYPDNFDKIKKILLPMFDENIVNEVLEDFSDKDNVFKYIPLPNNFDCDSCQAKQFCNYDKIEKIYLTVKEKSKQNPIDQMRLREIFKQN